MHVVLDDKSSWSQEKGRNNQFTVELNYHVGSALAFFSQPNLQRKRKPEGQRGCRRAGEEDPPLPFATLPTPGAALLGLTSPVPPLSLPSQNNLLLYPIPSVLSSDLVSTIVVINS